MKTKRNLQRIIFALGLMNIILVAIMFLGGSLFSKGRSEHVHQGKKLQNKIIEQLQLNQEQILDYEGLVDDHRKTIKFNENKMHQAQAALFQSLKSPDLKASQDSIIQQIGAAQIAIQKAHISHFDALRELCRPEQMNNFEVLCDELHQVFGRHHKQAFRPKKKQ